MDSSSSSRNNKKVNKFSVRKPTLFKKPFTSLFERQETILRKAGELSTLCDSLICVIHYDRLGNLVKTWPEDESQVQGVAERYSKLTHEEKQKKSTNLSKFCNKKMHDEKKRFSIKFSQKVQELEGSLVDKLQLLQDILLREDQSIMSEQNHNFPNYSSVPDHQQQSVSATSTEQDMSRGDVYNSAAATDQLLNHQSKYSIFLFNHENASFTQLPHSVSSSLQQTYYNNLSDNRALLGGQGFNFGFGNNNVTTALPEEQVNFGYYNNSLNNTQGFNFGSSLFSISLERYDWYIDIVVTNSSFNSKSSNRIIDCVCILMILTYTWLPSRSNIHVHPFLFHILTKEESKLDYLYK
ncbi:hypothetical protein YC2023_108889 [Brassica napus]